VPSTFVVNTTADTVDAHPGDGLARDAAGNTSLRAAVMEANADSGADVITFAPQVHGTIKLDETLGQLEITDGLAISGPGAGKLEVSGQDKVRVFYISPGTTAAISHLTITLEHAERREPPVLRSHGGGVLNDTDANLTLTDVILSHNTAQGFQDVQDEERHLGGAGGGGVANRGTLHVTGCTFIDNHAVGYDGQVGVVAPPPDFSAVKFPGIGIGGGLWNWKSGTATVTDSRFIDNLAKGGDRCVGTFAGLGQGGAIYNDNHLTVTGSLFSGNQAVGGSNIVITNVFSGPAVGGAISSGTNERLLGGVTESAVLEVSQCIFSDNQAHGGNNNFAGPPVRGMVSGAGSAAGGGIFVFQGEAAISRSILNHNQAIGGTGRDGLVGGLALGGGILFINFLDRPTNPGEVPGVMGTVESCALVQNEAIGGTGGAGNLARGGNALGGGIAAGTFGLGNPLHPLFGKVEVSNTLVAGNLAQGGAGGTGGAGGDGLGGGVYNDTNETMTVTRSLIVANRARGGEGQGGSNGLGKGGGVYNLAPPDKFTTTLTLILGNHADDSEDCFGCPP
jgi:hypothetical protein